MVRPTKNSDARVASIGQQGPEQNWNREKATVIVLTNSALAFALCI
jgi:hypothetical protein